MIDLVSTADGAATGKRPRLPRKTVDSGTDGAPGRRRTGFEGAVPSWLGLRFSDALPFDQWVEIGRSVGAHHNASLWWLGDWLNHGRNTYGRRYKYGVALTGLDYHTLRNYAMVARRFELSRRRDSLSFHHHAEVCSLSAEEQDRWLNGAEQGAWSRNELRRRLRNERHPEEDTVVTNLSITIDLSRRSRWVGAAGATGINLEAWIIHTLDAAAAVLLEGT